MEEKSEKETEEVIVIDLAAVLKELCADDLKTRTATREDELNAQRSYR